jgi:OOP family OmpA-OmpF porin
MLQYPESSVDVIGHTDISGPASYNLTLSEQRAQSVADVINSFGVNNSRINVKGEGVSNPVASNETREGRIQNRRADVVINEFEYQVN